MYVAPDTSSLIVKPIGFIRTPMPMKFDAPHQPDTSSTTDGRSHIELLPHYNFETALSDLSSFSHIWLVWWFHRNREWRPMVLPPRGPRQRRGVFATRSPHRPNPIGITAVELLKVEKRTLWIGNNDLVDSTPIIDIKPYLKTADYFPEASLGWLQEVEDAENTAPQYTVKISPRAVHHLEWLQERGINFIDRATKLLSRDPSPHRTRRITKEHDGRYRMGCGAWRIYFSLSEKSINIEEIRIGYAIETLINGQSDHVMQREVLIEFFKKFEQ